MRRHLHRRVFRTRSADGRVQEPDLKRVEPRLLPANPTLPLARSAITDSGILSASRDDQPKPSNSAALAAPDRLPVAAAGTPLRALGYTVLAGLVLAALAGFLWLAAPGTKTASSGGSASDPRQVVRLPEPIPAAARTPAATAADTPGERNTKPAAAAAAPPKAQDEVAQPAPPTSAMPPSGPAAGPPVSPPGAADIHAKPPAAKSFAQARPTAGNYRPDRSRATAGHTHPRSAAEPSTPHPHSRSVQHATPRQAQQAASFDRLVNQLTQPTPPAGQSLTPPAAGASDPFDRQSSEK